MILGVIPARSGSKSIKNKNLVNLGGKPLIAHTIATALKCPSINKVIVSTDSQKIALVAKRYGAEVPFLRPKSLAKDNTPMLPVINHAILKVEKQTGQRVKIVVVLDPTSPLRSVSDVEKCVKKLIREKADTVETVTESEHNPVFIMGYLKPGGHWQYLFPKQALSLTRRQDAPLIYRENAAVLATTREMVMKKKQLFRGKLMAVVMPQERSVHIDNLIDLKLAETILKL